MSILVALKHGTYYKYDKSIGMGAQTIRLKPAPHSRTPIHSYSLNIEPKEHFINWQQDAFGNYLARIVFPEKVKEFKVDVEVIAEMTVINPFDFFVEEYAETFPFAYENQLQKELTPYLEIVEKGPLLMDWFSKQQTHKGKNIVDFLVAINQAVYNEINYTVRMEVGVFTCEESLSKKLGSCRDSSWLLVQIMRHFGLAARFVSGYLVQLKADTKALDGPSGTEEDFTDLHAWCEVYIPGAGWIGLDPTSGLLAGEGHIPLSCTPDPVSAAPITGTLEMCKTEFEHHNKVFRIHEDPRVTKPYSEEQWEKILALGQKVDDELEQNDVRLTMGGEPTFVSVDDMESPEWNTSADGAHKRTLSNQLIRNLKESFAPQGLLQFGQGKWYPGEPVPRWKMGLYWRKDQNPLWLDKKLLANFDQEYNFTHTDAERFMQKLSSYLNINPNNITPAYEDIFYYLWEEGKLPNNVDPLKVNLKDSLERQSLREQLDRGLNNPVGFALPLEWNYHNNQWLSCRWEFARNAMYLIPGNSPIGLRLPLESLPYQTESQRPYPIERSPFEKVKPLEDYHKIAKEREGQEYNEEIPQEMLYPSQEIDEEEEKNNYPFKVKKEEKNDYKPSFEVFTIKKALAIEVREGKVCIFMPPLDHLEQYLDLLASIEHTATDLNIPVVIEGYDPPSDKRLEKLLVTPDPGVVEVNVHPAKTWEEILDNYSILFDAAFKSRLGAEKFMLDGKHTGTGGGNHITIGGVTPNDSPLLRNPRLLQSLITIWQHHPGLSYLFSTAFIGPTSQAPRVDEGRQEMLYELEIAFKQIPDEGEVPYWLVDRLFRNLLIDLTGNTHRAEFCIDKLYSPDSSSGRLGILEFRGFDMPPSKEMCLVQLLLIRTIIAWLWKHPYQHKLIRWGTQLHDKFLTHHYVKEDLKDLIEQMNRDGFFFDVDWLEPFFEFRFPHVGRVNYRDVELNLRAGIEPWNVLGEEMSNTGTARFVDSSVERVEVRVTGMNERYAILCNGLRIPMKKTENNGEYVASVRYRAWQPASALHPTLGVDTPLVFDIFDTWSGKSVGGCSYFVAHPGGRSYDTFPINAYEAEGRRVSRFWNFNHTQGVFKPQQNTQEVKRYIEKIKQEDSNIIYTPPIIEPDPEYPHTFDLRKFK